MKISYKDFSFVDFNLYVDTLLIYIASSYNTIE